MEADTPNLQIGWTYDQVFDTVEVDEDAGTTMNYFTVTLLPYIQAYLSFNSVYDLERLYYNDFTVELAKTKYELALYLTFNGDGDVCPGLGWNHDAADLAVSMISHFAECSKVIVYDIGTNEGIWRGDDAKWFETCTNSDDVTADFTTWNFYESLQNTIYLGTREADSVDHCYHFPDEVWPFSIFMSTTETVNPLDFATGLMYSRLGSYLGLNGNKTLKKDYALLGEA